MTNNEIINVLNGAYGLEHISIYCADIEGEDSCTIKLVDIVNLINRQKAEIEKLEEELNNSIAFYKTAAIKEFAYRLQSHSRKMSSSDFSGEFWDKAVLVSDIDNLVNEMVGDG